MTDEVKGLIEGIGRNFEEFKKANDERIAQIEKSGQADPLLTEKVDKLAESLNDLEAQKDALESMKSEVEKMATAAARNPKTATSDVDSEKAAAWARYVAKDSGRTAPENFDAKGMQEYKEAFFQYLRKGDQYANSLDGQKALSVGSDPDGGYTVMPDTSGRIVQRIFETSPVRQFASVQTIGTDALEGLYDLNEAGAGWVGETDSRPETDTPQLGKWRIPVHELYAFPFATQRLLDDSEVNMEAWLETKVADRFARRENAAFVNGDGIGKPRGFLTYPDGSTLPGTIERFGTGANGAFATAPAGGDVLIDVTQGIKPNYLGNANWFMNRSTMAAVRKLKNSDGDYLLRPGLETGASAVLLGYNVARFEDMPDLATGSLSIAFGDMSQAYQIVDRAGIRVLRDPFSNKPYIGFYTTKRVGGDVLNFEALKLVEFAS